MSVFNFFKKDNVESIDNVIGINEDVIEEGIDKMEDGDNQNTQDDLFKEIYESLEYTNSFLAQISLAMGELVKQQTIANALHILDSEYDNADSIMDVDEILQKKYALLGSIFIDYSAKEKEENDNE